MSSKLKILLIIQSCWFGTGRHVLDLSRELAKVGHDVHLIYASNRMNGTFERGLKDLKDLGVKTIPLVMRRELEFRDLSNLIEISRYIKSEGSFDIIHSHDGVKLPLLTRLSKVGNSAVHINTPHATSTTNPGLGPLKKWIYGKTEKFLGWSSHGTIAVSKEEYVHILEMGIPKHKVFLVPNGIDLSSPPISGISRREIGLEENDICIGFIGRFSAQKAPEVLLRAFAFLIHRFPTARLAIVGAGAPDLELILHSEAEKLGIAKRVLWLGEMNGSLVMPTFDIFALPSNYEGHPYVLLEAMAAGLPIVATRVGGVEATVVDGLNGYVVPPGFPELFAEALAILLASKDLRSKMGAASKEQSKVFSLEKMVDETVTIYETCLKKNSKR
jgi:glycosyltransferase involved in cell wall biosynthesis